MAMIAGGYNWDFSVLWDYRGLLLTGVIVTVEIAFISCALGSILSIPLTLGLKSKHRAIQKSCFAITECLRGTPLLVLLIWLYYVMPDVLPLSFSAFWTSIIALSANLAAFLADVLRGNMEAIPSGHIEAAEALGLSRAQVRRRVIIPETVRRSLPAISAFYIGALKLSTLASVIGAKELLFTSRIVNADNPHPLELYTFLAVMFLILVVPLSIFSKILETHPWFALYPKAK